MSDSQAKAKQGAWEQLAAQAAIEKERRAGLVPLGYGSLRGAYAIRPGIDVTKPIYDQVTDLDAPECASAGDIEPKPGGINWVPKGLSPGAYAEYLLAKSRAVDPPLYEVTPEGTRVVHPTLSDEATSAISLALKALNAVCRKGIEVVKLDDEEIDLFDVRRDLRALLGPD